jgi:hypothetical protein
MYKSSSMFIFISTRYSQVLDLSHSTKYVLLSHGVFNIFAFPPTSSYVEKKAFHLFTFFSLVKCLNLLPTFIGFFSLVLNI